MKVIKRDGRKVEYDSDKIVIAISQANKDFGFGMFSFQCQNFL